MASLSDNLKLMDLALGEEGAFGYANYGDLYDANLEFIEDALTEKSDITITTANVTLDDDQQRSIYLNLSGTLTGNRDLILKADQKGFWFVNNGTSGAFTVTIKPSGGTGVVVAQGSKTIVYSNGSAAIFIKNDLAAEMTAASSKATPVDADELALIDSAASNALKKLTWANLKATLLAVFGSNGIVARTAAGTFAARTITGTSNEISVSNGNGVSGDPTISLPTVAKPYGRQSIPIPAAAMKSRTTNGAATGVAEMTTNKNMFVTLDFDTSTQEFAQFSIAMPKSWNEGTVTFAPIWSHASTTTNFGVVWSLAGVALSNDDAGDVAFGTAQTSTDTGGTTNDIYIGPESSAITIAGSPAAEDLVMFQVARVPSDGSDTMAVDARLHGIVLYITTDSGNDA